MMIDSSILVGALLLTSCCCATISVNTKKELVTLQNQISLSELQRLDVLKVLPRLREIRVKLRELDRPSYRTGTKSTELHIQRLEREANILTQSFLSSLDSATRKRVHMYLQKLSLRSSDSTTDPIAMIFAS